MSTIYEKLAFLPKRIPILFQYGAGPTVEGTLLIPCPSLKCLQIVSNDKVRNIQHFINSYACHNDVKYLHFKTTEQITQILDATHMEQLKLARLENLAKASKSRKKASNA